MSEEDIKALEELAKDPKSYDKYISMCENFAIKYPEVLKYVDTNINRKDYLKIFDIAMQHEIAITYVSKDIDRYAELCEIAALTNGMSIQYISPELENYYMIVKWAVLNNGMALQFVKEEDYKIPEDEAKFYSNFSGLQKKALERSNGEALQFISPDAEDYREKCLYALECSKGLALQHIPRDIANYSEYCINAVCFGGKTIQIVPKDIENYEELCKIAVSVDGESIQFISKEEVNNYEELEDRALATTPTALQFIPRYQNDLEKIVEITEKSPHAFEYASPEIRANIDAVVNIMNNCKARREIIVQYFDGATDPMKLVELADRTKHRVMHLSNLILFNTPEERAAFNASLTVAEEQYKKGKEKERRKLLKEANKLQLRLNEINARLKQLDGRNGNTIGKS